MAIIYKLCRNSKFVRVIKTINKDEITDEDFNKKAKLVPIDKFVEKLRKDDREHILESVKQLEELQKMDLHKFGVEFVKDFKTNSIKKVYLVGSSRFVDGVDKTENKSAKENAIEFGKLIFGDSFMENNKDFIEKDKLGYFYGDILETKEFYNTYCDKIKELLSIKVIANKRNR